MSRRVMRERGASSSADSASGVRVFPPETAIDEEDGLILDVIAKPKTTQADAVLTFAGRDALEFLDGMCPAVVVGILPKDFYRLSEVAVQVRMSFDERLVFALETGGRTDGEGRHTLIVGLAPASWFPVLFRNELLYGPKVPRGYISLALADDLPDFGVSEFQVVLQLVCAHNSGDGDAVLLQNEILARKMGALRDGAEVDARFRYGNAMDHRCGLWFGSQGR